MRFVNVPKAQALGFKRVEGVNILIENEIPSQDSLADQLTYFDNVGKEIAEALFNALPQGILKPLTAHLLRLESDAFFGQMEYFKNGIQKKEIQKNENSNEQDHAENEDSQAVENGGKQGADGEIDRGSGHSDY